MKRACWYNLNILTKDERKLIYLKLDWIDWTVAQIAYNDTYHYPDYFAEICAKLGYLEILQWINPPFFLHGYIINIALKRGHLHIIQWFHKSIVWGKWIYCDAAAYGHLHIIQWARSLDPPIPWDEKMCDYAIMSNHIEVLKWGIENGAPLGSWAIKKANEKGLLV